MFIKVSALINSLSGFFAPSAHRDKSSRGFTLVELLVVIAIIGILATLLLLQLTVARGKARDVKRIADINQIRTSVELYFDDNAKYLSTMDMGILAPKYINQIPQDPLAGTGCTANTYNGVTVGAAVCYGYAYWPAAGSALKFQLWAELEQWTAALGSDADINSLAGGTWGATAGGGALKNGTIDTSTACTPASLADCIYDQGVN